MTRFIYSITLTVVLTATVHSQTSNYKSKTMFTLEQIREAHSKVKSGADFPRYAQELKALGLHHYDHYLTDGHTDYYGNGHSINGPARYEEQSIADSTLPGAFLADLKTHQNGGSDFLTFSKLAAGHGVEKWTVHLEDMTCIYYDKQGTAILVEHIPAE